MIGTFEVAHAGSTSNQSASLQGASLSGQQSLRDDVDDPLPWGCCACSAARVAVESAPFRVCTRVVTIAFIVCLGVMQPNNGQSESFEVSVAWAEIGMSASLVLSVALRCAAYGISCDRRSFFRRNVWNVLDSVCLLVCMLQAVPSWMTSPWIRAARCPLSVRLLVEFEGLGRVMRCLRRALPLLWQNFILVVYLMAIVCIIAVKSWMMNLEMKCLVEADQETYLPFTTFDWPCGGGFTCLDLAEMYPPVNGLNMTCALNTTLYVRHSMNYNNVAASMLTMLRVLSLDDVKMAMVDIMTISGKPFALYIVVVVLVISFLCVYLFLAILVDAFAQDRAEFSETSQETTVFSVNKSLMSASMKDASAQVFEEDIELAQQSYDAEATVFMTERHRTTPALSTFDEGSIHTGRFQSMKMLRQSTPSVTQVLSSFSEGQLEDLPSWRRPIPLPLFESVRRRGFWITLHDIECTTSHGPISGRWRVVGSRLLTSRAATVLALVLSVVNTVCLASIYFGMPGATRDSLINTTIGVTLYFVVPLLAKLIVFGWWDTFTDAWNIVDALAVITALFEAFDDDLFVRFSLVQGLRTIRVLRIGKLVTPLERFTRSVFTSWYQMVQLFVCYGGFLFVFAVAGQTLFGDTYASRNPSILPNPLWDNRMSRDSFGTLWESLIMCFMILGGDRWTTRLQIAMEQDIARSAASVVFFLTLYLVGNYILLNTFVVLLTEATAQTLSEEAAEVELQHPPSLLLPLYSSTEKARSLKRRPTVVNFKRQPQAASKSAEGEERRPDRPWYAWMVEVQQFRAVGLSFSYFAPTDDLRQLCLHAVGSNIFHVCVVCAVLANAVLLMYESSYNNHQEREVLEFGYLGLLIVFWVEMFMKMVAFGVVWPAPEVDLTAVHPHVPAFLRDPWNILDFITNSLCLAAQIYTPLRAAVALRTFRLASLTEYTRRIVDAMIECLPQIFNAIAVALYFITIFAVLGVQLFGGRFQSCNDRSITLEALCVGNYSAVEIHGTPSIVQRQWSRSEFHFDSFPSAMLSMLTVACGGSWTNIMYDGMDVGEPMDGLEENRYPLYCLFFIAAFVLVNMFSLRLATALMINFFSMTTKRRDGSVLLTADQQKYVKARDTIDALIIHRGSEMHPLDSTVSVWLHKVLTYNVRRWWLRRPLFDVGMRFVAVVNSAVIITIHRESAAFEQTLRDCVDLVALGFFIMEAALKLVVYGPRQYLSSKWNAVDFLMIPMILLGFLFSRTEPISFFSAVVLLKLLKHTQLEELLWYIAKNIAYYINVLLLLFLVFFVYAAAGVITFGHNVLDVPGTNEMFNLRNVPSALLVLFATCTGRGWETIMNALASAPPGCAIDGESQDRCGSKTQSVFYFVTFIVVGVFAVLHLLVAVVVEIFRSNLDRTEPTIAAFFQLKDLWDHSCGVGVGSVHIDRFLLIVADMPVLLTGLTFARRAAFMRLIASLQIPIDAQHRIKFNDVIRAFVWRRYKVENRSALFVFQEQNDATEPRCTVADALAAKIIQKMFRDYKRRQRDELRNRALAVRRQMMRKRGRYDEGDDSYVDSQDPSIRRPSTAPHQVPDELLKVFASMSTNAHRLAEVTLPQSIGEAIPEGALYIPDSTLFAFGGLGGVSTDTSSKVDSSTSQ